MIVLGKNLIDDFKKKYSYSRKALDRFVKLLECAEFNTPNDVKKLFGANVDFVENTAIFDVGGNKIRTITKIQYGVRVILITHVLTHSDYDKNKWRNVK